METIDQFKDYCLREMSEDLLVLERMRRSIHIKLLAVAVAAFCAGAFLINYIQQHEIISGTKAALIAAGCVGFFVLIITAAVSQFINKEYGSAFKLSVMCKLVQFLDASLQYDPTGFVSEGLYALSKLYRQQVERYSGGNLVKGCLGKVDVTFSEVLSEYYIKRKGGKNWIPIFSGLLFVADFHRNFAGQTLVLTDVAEKLLGKIGRALQSIDAPVGSLVKFDDAEFEKYFAVYSDNEEQAGNILTPVLMSRMVDFRKKSRSRIQLSFTGSRVFVAVPFNKSPCRAPLFGPIINFSRFERYFENIELAVGVIQDINHNTRIWNQVSTDALAPALL